jgi:hypothetical protein
MDWKYRSFSTDGCATLNVRLGGGSSFLKECDDKLVHGPSDDPLWQSRARPSIN